MAGKIDSWPAITFIFYSKSGPLGWESIRCVLRNGQGGSLTLLDNLESILSCDVIGGRTLSRFPERIPRFSPQSRNDNELARNRNSVLNRFSRHVVLLIVRTFIDWPSSPGVPGESREFSNDFARLRENADVRTRVTFERKERKRDSR